MFDTQELRAGRSPRTTCPPSRCRRPAAAQPIHLLDRLNAVFKHRRVAGTAFVLVVTAMMVQTYSTIPMYQTAARIQIEDERSTSVGNLGVNDPSYWQESAPYYQHAVQDPDRAASSARRVVRKLELAEASRLQRERAETPRSDHADPAGARVGVRVDARAGLQAARAGGGAAGRRTRARRKRRSCRAFLAGVDGAAVPETRLVDIVYSTPTRSSPRWPPTRWPRSTRRRTSTCGSTTPGRCSTGSTTELDEGDREGEGERGRADAVPRDQQRAVARRSQNVVVSRLNSLSETVTSQAHGAAAESRRCTTRSRTPTRPATRPTAIRSSGTARRSSIAQGSLAALKAEQATLAQNFGRSIPQMKDIDREDRGRHQAARRRAAQGHRRRQERVRGRASRRNAASRRDLERAKADSIDLDRKSGDYKILQRDDESNRQLFKSLLDAAEEPVGRREQPREQRPADGPRRGPQRTPISPNPRKDWITAILAGLTIAFGLAFGIEYLDDTVKTPEDVTRRLKLPLLGLVPAVRGDHVPVLTETGAARLRRSVPIARARRSSSRAAASRRASSR